MQEQIVWNFRGWYVVFYCVSSPVETFLCPVICLGYNPAFAQMTAGRDSSKPVTLSAGEANVENQAKHFP